MLTAQVSTARPDTSDVTAPHYVPGTAAAVKWATGLLEVETLAGHDAWDLSNKNLSATEHVAHLALLVGRAHRSIAPTLTALNLQKCQITPSGGRVLADGLFVNSVLTELNLYRNEIGDEGAKAIGAALHVNSVLTDVFALLKLAPTQTHIHLPRDHFLTTFLRAQLNLRYNSIGPEGAKAIGDALHVNSVLTSLDLGWNDLGGGEAALREIAKDRPSLTLKL